MIVMKSIYTKLTKLPILLILLSSFISLAFAAEQKEKQKEEKKPEDKQQAINQGQNKQSKSKSSKTVIQESVLGMNVSGNKESPNVLYIVPWKGSTSAAKLPEVSPLVNEIFSPVDPEVFIKQVKFYQQLTEQTDDTK